MVLATATAAAATAAALGFSRLGKPAPPRCRRGSRGGKQAAAPGPRSRPWLRRRGATGGFRVDLTLPCVFRLLIRPATKPLLTSLNCLVDLIRFDTINALLLGWDVR
jgi:hypothetical protein